MFYTLTLIFLALMTVTTFILWLPYLYGYGRKSGTVLPSFLELLFYLMSIVLIVSTFLASFLQAHAELYTSWRTPSPSSPLHEIHKYKYIPEWKGEETPAVLVRTIMFTSQTRYFTCANLKTPRAFIASFIPPIKSNQ
ncbi:hypothetical protein K439DRAFT_50714 [Ramaria rubella]|nr:hypothetical protein K439DRAFT_50714 [Ramaria rubella]